MSNRYQKVSTELKNNPKRWLVTGAAGFIGSHIVERLLNLGQHVVALDNFATGHRKNLELIASAVGSEARQKMSFIEGSITDDAICEIAANGADYVIHQAALGSVPRSIEEPGLTNDANVTGFLKILTAARDAGAKRFVYASSSAVYGDSPGLPKVEDVIGNCLSPYAVSKRINELYARIFDDLYGLKTIGLRYFNVYGPRQDPNGAYAAVIPKWIDSLRKGEQCICYGDGETSRDFCYVDNIVQANILAACSDQGTNEVYNIALGDQTTLTALYDELVHSMSELNPDFEKKPLQYKEFRSGDIKHSLADISKVQGLLGFDPEVRVRDGILKTVKWFLENT